MIVLASISSVMKKVDIPLSENAPETIQVKETGYGFAVLEIDDPSTVVQVDSTTNEAYPVQSFRKVIFNEQFNTLYFTHYMPIYNGNPKISIVVFKDKTITFDPITGFNQVVEALTYAQLYMLMASQSTTRYKLWEIDASTTEIQTYTDPNQQYWATHPLLQSIQVLSVADGCKFALSTTAWNDPFSLTPTPQEAISSDYLPVGSTLRQMGFSYVYTPVTPATGTNVFLISIQQPLSGAQLKQIQMQY